MKCHNDLVYFLWPVQRNATLKNSKYKFISHYFILSFQLIEPERSLFFLIFEKNTATIFINGVNNQTSYSSWSLVPCGTNDLEVHNFHALNVPTEKLNNLFPQDMIQDYI